MSNNKIGVEVKSTSDFPPDFILTNTYIPNTLERTPKVSEISILNHTSLPISITDVNGLISKHDPIKLNATFINTIGISSEAKYIYIIERRVVDNDDLVSTTRYNNKKNIKGDLYNIIHKKIANLSPEKRSKEIYVIYQIDVEYLCLKRNISLKEMGLSVSLIGYEDIPYGHHHNGIEHTMSVEDEKVFSTNIVYYHNDPNECIFINILNKTIRIDSIPIESEIEGEGVMMFYNNLTNIEKLFIKPVDFKKHNIYNSVNEAKASMNKEEIIANRKLEVELMNIESRFFTTISNDVNNMYKIKMEVFSRKNQILLDIDKIKNSKVKTNNISTILDNTKKYIDVILMIKKIILL